VKNTKKREPPGRDKVRESRKLNFFSLGNPQGEDGGKRWDWGEQQARRSLVGEPDRKAALGS